MSEAAAREQKRKESKRNKVPFHDETFQLWHAFLCQAR